MAPYLISSLLCYGTLKRYVTNKANLTVFLGGRRLLNERAGEPERGVSADDVHLELRPRPHLRELLLFRLLLILTHVFGVHRVVHVECYYNAGIRPYALARDEKVWNS